MSLRAKFLGMGGVVALLVVAVVWFWPLKLQVLGGGAALPADGREHLAFKVVSVGIRRLRAEDLVVRDGDSRAVAGANGVEIWVKSPVAAGSRRVVLGWRGRSAASTVHFVPSYEDSFGDGTPDALRLHGEEDRRAFRRWFTALAEMQSELPEAERAPEVQDCAALLRYAYRETLRRHDAVWSEGKQYGGEGLSSVRQWQYPETMLGTGLFRVRPGPFVAGDLKDGAFAQFADAHALMTWNTYAVGRSLRAARPGDLLFYRQLEQNSPYHSMVVVGERADTVVYHTGPIGRGKGEMRRVALGDLLHHPDARWRPVQENSNFIGVFRWNVLREGD